MVMQIKLIVVVMFGNGGGLLFMSFYTIVSACVTYIACTTQVTLEVINYTLFIYDRWLFFFHIQFLFNFPACKHRVVVFTGYVNLEID